MDGETQQSGSGGPFGWSHHHKSLCVFPRGKVRVCVCRQTLTVRAVTALNGNLRCVCECHWVMVSHSGRLRSVSPNQTSEISSYSACVGRGGRVSSHFLFVYLLSNLLHV